MPQERSKKDQRNGGYTKEFQQYFFKALILSIFGFENVLEILYNLEKKEVHSKSNWSDDSVE